MGCKEFNKDIIEGKNVEIELKRLFEEKKHIVKFVDEKNEKFWDLEVDGKNTIEVKCDTYSNISTNAAIEFLYKGHPSGISITKADFWVHKYMDEFYVICVEDLRKLIKNNEFMIVNGGDDYLAKMYLIPSDIFLSNFKKLSIKENIWLPQ